VVLTLKNLFYRHTEIGTLTDFLVEKYGFKKIEEYDHDIYELKDMEQIDRKDILFEEETKAPIVIEKVGTKSYTDKIIEGNYLGEVIKAYVLGEINRTENVVEISADERYPVYTAEYQMIKLVSESGYALQGFLEKLIIDLGLRIESINWSFHRQ